MIYKPNQPRTKRLGASLCSSRRHLLQIIASACPKQGPAGETLWDPTGPRQDAGGQPKHAARTLIRHSDRRTMRTTQATDLHPRRIPEVSHETKNATRLHTYTMGDDARPHAILAFPPPPKPSACRPTIPRTTTTVAGLVHSCRSDAGVWGVHVKRRALGRFLRPHGCVGRDADPVSSIDYTTIYYSLVFRPGDPSRGGLPNRPRVVGPALCMMQPSRTSLVRACLRDSCPPAWRGCNRHLVL